ncbi:MAG TPA: VOC family protein [Candidatus Acidoferrum sp.]|nr:VOC family protein [Candidatus Acidoferrum sp.]
MKRTNLLIAMLVLCASTPAQQNPQRPRIFGIEGVTIYVSDAHKSRTFYAALLDQDPHPKHVKRRFSSDEQPPEFSLNISPNRFQFIGLEPAHSPAPSNLIAEVTFSTDNVAALRSYLLANLTDTRSLTGPGMKYLSLADPEGHKISFLETDGVLKDPKIIAILTKGGYENEIIHAAFIVHDRAATEHFYKDILGFRPYWHGGMKDDQTDWVSMQVPDGTDWLEFMVNVEPDADQRLRGIMNHIAIGTTDIHATQKKLIDKGVKLTEQPKIGRDGKWQLNLYDPDGTRIEFMEFKPAQQPCCHPYTAPHPKP